MALRPLFFRREQNGFHQPLQSCGEILIGLADHAPLQRPFAQVGREEARFSRLFLYKMFDNGSRLIEREPIIDEHRDPVAGVQRKKLRLPEITGVI
jgi:hypothetical protein